MTDIKTTQNYGKNEGVRSKAFESQLKKNNTQ